MPMLTWERRDGQRMVFHLQSPETTIGREVGNEIRIESGYVSKRHAVVRMGAQGYTLADLNSSNGTTLNGQPITMAVLKDGDRIELGAEVLVFSNPAATQPGAAAPQKRNPLMLALVGGGGVILIALVALILFGGSPAPTQTGGSSAAPGGPPPADANAPPDAPVFPPAPGTPTAPGAAATAAPSAGAEALPSQDPVALYEMALAHVKGKRLVEAKRLLEASVQLDPGNQSTQQRLREVNATIQAMIDQNLAGGQRDFMYLRYDEAILQWEQVLSMTTPTDARYQQAAAGIQRARERLKR